MAILDGRRPFVVCAGWSPRAIAAHEREAIARWRFWMGDGLSWSAPVGRLAPAPGAGSALRAERTTVQARQHLSPAHSHFPLHRDARVTTKYVHNFHTRRIFAGLGIFIETRVAHGFQRTVFARAIILPVMLKWFSVVPVKIHRPKIYEIESAFHRALFQGFQFLARHFGERRKKFCQLDVNVR